MQETLTGESRERRARAALATLALLMLGGPAVAAPSDTQPTAPTAIDAEPIVPSREEIRERIEEEMPEGQQLTAREIYERHLDNKVKASVQVLRVISSDPGGSEQATRFTVRAQDFRDENKKAVEGVLAKTVVNISDPFDVRHTAYLMIAKDPGPDDEFVYRPEARRVNRVNLRGTTLLGTDYSFDDLGFQNIDDADYIRMPDEEVEGRVVYVVEAIIKDTSEGDYGKTLSYIEQDHYIPLRTRYWDHSGVEAKESTADPDTIKQFDDVWVAVDSRMKNHLEGTESRMHVVDLKADPDFDRHVFSLHRLARGR